MGHAHRLKPPDHAQKAHLGRRQFDSLDQALLHRIGEGCRIRQPPPIIGLIAQRGSITLPRRRDVAQIAARVAAGALGAGFLRQGWSVPIGPVG